MPYSTSKFAFLLVFVVMLSWISIDSALAEVQKPSSPENLMADDVSPTQIDLSWETPDDNGGSPITGYKIEFKKVPGSYSVLVENTQNSTTTYSHTGLETGASYVYRVYAINEEGQSEASDEAVAKPTSSSTPPEEIPPNPPRKLTAIDVSPTQIDLSWLVPEENNGPPLSGYRIDVMNGSSSFSTIINNTQNTNTSYSHENLTTGTTYTYRVYALNSVGYSDASNTISATPTKNSSPPVNNIVPNRPSDFSVISLSPTEVYLSWDEPEPNNSPKVSGYKIEVKRERNPDNQSSESFDVLVENTIRKDYKHSGLSNEYTYTYRVYAINSVGQSSPAEGKVIPSHTLVPSGVKAEAVSSTQIDLSWFPPSQTYGQRISSYLIKEEIFANKYETIAKINSDITKHSIKELTTGKEYTYVVVAKYTLGSSDISAKASAIPLESSGHTSDETSHPPSPPRNLTVKTVSPIQIDLTWQAPSSDGGSPITGYRIDYKVESGKYTTLVKDSQNTKKMFSHSDRKPGTKYTYQVYAINEAGISAPSNESSATPTILSGSESNNPPKPPQNLSAKVIDSSNNPHILLSWQPPTDSDGDDPTITGYKVEYRNDGDSTYTVLERNMAKTTSYMHTPIEEGAVYHYQLYSINKFGNSNPAYTKITVGTFSESDDSQEKPIPASFVDTKKDPQYYIERYNNEPEYKAWFDDNYPQYSSIYEAVGMDEPTHDEKTIPAPFVDPSEDPQYYVDRYKTEPVFKEWFDDNFPQYSSIYEAVGLQPPPEEQVGMCGPDTVFKNGTCVLDQGEAKTASTASKFDATSLAVIVVTISAIGGGVAIYMIRFRK